MILDNTLDTDYACNIEGSYLGTVHDRVINGITGILTQKSLCMIINKHETRFQE